MARPHGRGYIRETDYWHIGTEDARGRDGYTAREAAQRYNDHRHPAFTTQQPADVVNWRSAALDTSVYTQEGITLPGGYEATASTSARQPGDVVFYNGRPFITNGGELFGISGFGGSFSADPVPAFTRDVLAYPVAQIAQTVALPVADAVDNFMRTNLSFYIDPANLRVQSADAIAYELSFIGALRFSLAPAAVLTDDPNFAPYAVVRRAAYAADEAFVSESGVTFDGSTRVNTYAGTPGAGLLSNTAQASPGWYTYISVFEPRKSLQFIEYQMCTAAEAFNNGAAPTEAQTAAYTMMLGNVTLEMHAVQVRAQITWGT